MNQQIPTKGSKSRATSMSTERVFKFPFYENSLKFDEMLPSDLGERLPYAEFQEVFARINQEFLAPLIACHKKVRDWSIVCGTTSPILVGIFLTPLLAHHVNNQQRLFKNLWSGLRAYFLKINQETFFERGIQWKVVEDEEKISKSGVYNKLVMHRIDIILRRPRAEVLGRANVDPTAMKVVPGLAATLTDNDNINGNNEALNRPIQSYTGHTIPKSIKYTITDPFLPLYETRSSRELVPVFEDPAGTLSILSPSDPDYVPRNFTHDIMMENELLPQKVARAVPGGTVDKTAAMLAGPVGGGTDKKYLPPNPFTKNPIDDNPLKRL